MKYSLSLLFAIGATSAMAAAGPNVAPVPAAARPAILDEAERALAEGIPQVAIAKIQSALAGNIAGSDVEKAKWLLAEAQLAAGHADDANATLATLPERPESEAILLRANAQAAAGNWSEALPHYQTVAARANAPLAAAVGEVECLQALGRTAEAVALLENLLKKGASPVSLQLRLASLYIENDRATDARKALKNAHPSEPSEVKLESYLQARIFLLEKNPKAALGLLEPLLTEKLGMSQNLVAAATLADAEARLALSGPDAAEKVLESFIRQSPDSPHLELLFRRLDQVYALDTNPTEGALHGFFNDAPPRTAGLAQFYVTRMQLREKRYERAQKSLDIFLKKFPEHELTPYALKMEADLHLQAGNLTAAEHSLEAASRTATSEQTRAEFALNTALINLRQGEFVRAATRLKEAESFPRLKQTAAYDAALGWLMQQNYRRFREELASFAAEFQTPMLIGQLRLEEGLVQARNNQDEASGTLKAFLRDYPNHPRKSEAQIAMAELAFEHQNYGEAETILIALNENGAPAETEEQAAYLAVFLAEKKSQPSDVVRLAKEFVGKYPKSAEVTEVRMKLGQVYFAQEDYLKAQEQFEGIAASDPNGSYAEMALFLAGQCGMRMINTDALNHAVELFDNVAERKGPMETRARLQEAIIKNKLGAEDDAVKIYDTILSASALDPEVRYAAQIGKGDNLVALAQDQKRPETARQTALNDAIQSYQGVLVTRDAPPEWSNQAAYKKGKALLQLGRNDEALVEFYDVLNRNTEGSRETFWYAKAGFDAAALLEAKQNWKNAVAVYEKMAQIPGQHVAQARQRVKTLRLEHRLWD